MARGYATFANGGFLIDPFFIWEIRDAEGDIVYRANPPQVCESCVANTATLSAAPAEEGTGEPEYRPLAIAGNTRLADFGLSKGYHWRCQAVTFCADSLPVAAPSRCVRHKKPPLRTVTSQRKPALGDTRQPHFPGKSNHRKPLKNT